MLLHLLGFTGDVIACHTPFARGRLAQSREHAHSGRLACTIRPEEAEDFAPLNLKANPIDGMEVAEALAQISGYNYLLAHCFSKFAHDALGCKAMKQSSTEGLICSIDTLVCPARCR